jgi:outer membrane protein OmpA-like peptidoglycan-associated protein
MAVYSQKNFTVYFDFNKYDLTPQAQSQLDSFMLAEKTTLSKMIIQLYGHCDAIGSATYNDKLSKQRVATVKKYLKKNGLDEQNIGDEIGYGKRQPLNENNTDEERQLNRRVEIRFIQVILSGMTRISGDISLKEKIADSTVTSGTNIVLRNINFVGGMHQFLPESEPMLNELLDAMRTYPKLVIRVEGHICCQQGNADGVDHETGIDNLSEARAKAVMDYLLLNGIESKRVSFEGFGHSVPIYPFPERSEEERTQNRRVEIRVLKK